MDWKYRSLAGAIIENAIRDILDGTPKQATAARRWFITGAADMWLAALDVGEGATGAGILAAIDAGRVATAGPLKIDGQSVGAL